MTPAEYLRSEIAATERLLAQVRALECGPLTIGSIKQRLRAVQDELAALIEDTDDDPR